jgi:hypothetical protein
MAGLASAITNNNNNDNDNKSNTGEKSRCAGCNVEWPFVSPAKKYQCNVCLDASCDSDDSTFGTERFYCQQCAVACCSHCGIYVCSSHFRSMFRRRSSGSCKTCITALKECALLKKHQCKWGSKEYTNSVLPAMSNGLDDLEKYDSDMIPQIIRGQYVGKRPSKDTCDIKTCGKTRDFDDTLTCPTCNDVRVCADTCTKTCDKCSRVCCLDCATRHFDDTESKTCKTCKSRPEEKHTPEQKDEKQATLAPIFSEATKKRKLPIDEEKKTAAATTTSTSTKDNKSKSKSKSSSGGGGGGGGGAGDGDDDKKKKKKAVGKGKGKSAKKQEEEKEEK